MQLDYVVVGAGAAGCALANRLSENPSVSVLLLDRGPRHEARVARVPRLFPFALRPPRLISYETRPLASTGQPDYWVRGVGLGGSTVLNGMMYLRGEPAAYDELESAGAPGWGWNTFRTAFEQIERDWLHPSTEALNPLSELLIDAVRACGARQVPDVNAAIGPRAGATSATIHRGRRNSAYRAFIAPIAGRPNLSVLSGVVVDELLWQGRRVVGVRATREGQPGEIRAGEVIVCAGTIETPLLLERSGIGRPDLLEAAGIEVRAASPRVGEGVREQRGQARTVWLQSAVAGASELSSPLSQAIQGLRYAATQKGPLARPAYDVSALLASGSHGGPVDLQVMATPFALDPSGALRPARAPGVLLVGYPIRPTTTSSIHIDPADPSSAPIIAARFEQTAEDAAASRATAATLARIAGAPPLAALTVDGPRPAGTVGSSIYHAVGSAAMGADDQSVADAQLRVRGVEGLRIADLSVLPFHTSGATAAPAMALGWIAGSRLS